MLTRRVTFRFTAGAVLRPTTRIETSLPFRIATQSDTALGSSRAIILPTTRSYATPSKPKKGSIGESSSRKRSPKTEEQKANEKEAAKGAKAVAATEKAALKKAQDLKKQQKAENEKKQKLKEKEQKAKEKQQKIKERAAAKAKQALQKKASKKTVERPLSEEAQTRKRLRENKAELQRLKDTALSPPPRHPLGAWRVLTSEHVTELFKTREPGSPTSELLTRASREAAVRYKNMSPAELEHYNHISNQRSADMRKAYNEWLQAHTPDQVREANSARTKLRRMQTKATRKWSPLEDERLVIKPKNAFLFFSMDRHESGDLTNIEMVKAGILIGEEWKALSASEKQKYLDRQHRDRERYAQEYRLVYGYEVPYGSHTRQPVASTP